MRYRWAVILVVLIGLAVLGRLVSPKMEPPEPTSTPVAKEVVKIVPTLHPGGAGEFDIAAWDIDGDGAFTPAEFGPATLAYADVVEFAPGWEFDPFRFGNDYRDVGWKSWTLDSPIIIVTQAQACSWMQHWMDAMQVDDDPEAERSLIKVTELHRDQPLGEMEGVIGAIITAAEAGDADRVQHLFTGGNCHLTWFVDDSLGPQGVVTSWLR